MQFETMIDTTTFGFAAYYSGPLGTEGILAVPHVTVIVGPLVVVVTWGNEATDE